jgi:hypothetical protein
MNEEEILDELEELRLTQLVHSTFISLVLAELTLEHPTVRESLENLLWQAEENAKVHIPAEVGQMMPEINRITKDLFALVNKQLPTPLKPVKISR